MDLEYLRTSDLKAKERLSENYWEKKKLKCWREEIKQYLYELKLAERTIGKEKKIIQSFCY